MSFGSKILGFGGFANRESAYSIDTSCMFDNGNEAYLKRTPSSASNRKTWTFSAWMKGIFTNAYIFGAYSGSGTSDDNYALIWFDGDQLEYIAYQTTFRTTNRVFRDPSAWYHIVVTVDTTQGTADNRVKIYVNGVQETSFATKNNPSQNYDLGINTTNEHRLGRLYNSGTSTNYNGYMADVHFIDGTALDASHFGETSSETGEWIPKAYKTSSGAYGTNGFYLKFTDAYPGTIAATGGTITTSGDYKVHTFNSSGTFTVTGITGGEGAIDYLVIAGGGGGGYSYGGGGGAGGYRTSYGSASGGGSGPEARVQVKAQQYTITVGSGGPFAPGNSNPADATGNASSIAGTGFTTISSVAGGGGGNYSYNQSNSGYGDGEDGGSGGGAGTADTAYANHGEGTAGQGYHGGGDHTGSAGGGASGGGGAGAVGATYTTNNGGAGGAGVASTITGSSVTRAGGGGGGGYSSEGAGGSGGGGAGGDYGPMSATNGTANTGGGGGGWTGHGGYVGGNGGSGVVIIRYKFQ